MSINGPFTTLGESAAITTPEFVWAMVGLFLALILARLLPHKRLDDHSDRDHHSGPEVR